MLKVVIIEDEELAAQKLTLLLHQIDPQIHVLDVVDSVANAVTWLGTHKADIIFLDINLSDDHSFKIFDEVQIDTPIIFTTAYDEFAIKAFDFNSISYLLKPIDIEELRKGLNKFRKMQQRDPAEFHGDMTSMMHYIQSQQKRTAVQTRIVVNYGSKLRSIDLTDVALFYSKDKATSLRTNGGAKYLVDKSLDQLEEMVSPASFFRVNRNFLVNLHSIDEVIPFSSRKLKLSMKVSLDDMILVPTEKITRFKQWFSGADV